MEKINFPTKAQQLLDKRLKNNNLRSLPIFSPDNIDFFSNDYLGIARELQKIQISHSHAGSTGSRLISGNSPYYEEVERYLADFYKGEKALLFNSGYNANLAVLSAIPQRGDFILYDELSHASLRDGIRLSNAKSLKFKHNDISDLSKKIKKCTGEIFVVLESVYSMDGDEILREILELCHEKKCHIILDEAHGTGVLGAQKKGIFEDFDKEILARVHTFGKALGTHGACVVGCKKLHQYLVNFARPFIYTTAMSEAQIEVIFLAHKILNKSDLAHKKLTQNIAYFNEKIAKNNTQFLKSQTPIQAYLNEQNILKDKCEKLLQKNISVKSILSPTVPISQERIRITLHSFNTFSEIDELLEVILSP
ncbi:aminotransferase class I/II-fold pyridoxal phosphate-dependent enzyme [Ornithobacterium rhinotracheale]|uniref:aminotransferase class I/II-fold pyridoxal phosphate-dependent enzyme n=1 Tax=Ornithobacterium rhinotracheale TaxID=28251 RepID=UPI00129C7FBC|nr:aminotransferase class I/II-fold pyridoxal phosphate-dependent enzyme [Ornithobacterium rhinotracheale]MRJ11161.1 aminotransferase class I/II-fold pyridoxal phosphate-dependent enzyme [Ornithobacterium rhinotracheale]